MSKNLTKDKQFGEWMGGCKCQLGLNATIFKQTIKVNDKQRETGNRQNI